MILQSIATTKTRQAEQISRLSREAEDLERQAERKRFVASEIAKESERIVDLQQYGAVLYRRFITAAKKEIRYHLTGERRKTKALESSAMRLFEYIYRKWRDAGCPESGVQIPLKALAKSIDRCQRQTIRLAQSLAPYVQTIDQGQKPNRYRVALPDTAEGDEFCSDMALVTWWLQLWHYKFNLDPTWLLGIS